MISDSVCPLKVPDLVHFVQIGSIYLFMFSLDHSHLTMLQIMKTGKSGTEASSRVARQLTMAAQVAVTRTEMTCMRLTDTWSVERYTSVTCYIMLHLCYMLHWVMVRYICVTVSTISYVTFNKRA